MSVRCCRGPDESLRKTVYHVNMVGKVNQLARGLHAAGSAGLMPSVDARVLRDPGGVEMAGYRAGVGLGRAASQ